MTHNSYAQTKGVQLLESVLEEVGPIFSVQDVRHLAAKLGLSPQDLRWTLSALAGANWIDRIKRSVYVVRSPMFPEEIHPFAIAAALVDPMAISHWSALAHHGMTTQIPPMVQASTPKKVVTPEMRKGEAARPRGRAVWRVSGIEIEFINVGNKRFFGLQQEWVSRWHRVAIADREKTFLDMVARSDVFGGIQVALETFEVHGHSLELDQLVRYALQYDMGSVIKRLGWLLEQFDCPAEVTEPLLQYPVRTYYRLDPREPRSGASSPRWRIINNLMVANSNAHG